MTREDQLAELLERWEETLSSGRTATAEDLCDDCPELLNDFRGLLARLGAVNALLAGHGGVSPEELTARVEAGRYRPLSFHAQGGLGIVFVAEDDELHRNVALKCMQDLAATDADARTRFLLEAEITSKLEHPGIVPVYGLGRDAHGKPYYAMRFVDGPTLAHAIERFHKDSGNLDEGERHVALQQLLRRFVSVCETVAYAHARGVVHRDLKPANIMLGNYGETLVVDWGLAKRKSGKKEDNCEPALPPLRLKMDNRGHTAQGEIHGSPTFMSPEQARGEWDQVGPASDVYSLGATLYVLLVGKNPFDGSTPRDVIEKVKAGAFPAPCVINATVPRPLDAICRKAMSYEPAARYVSATDLALDLERWLADEPVAAWREPLQLRGRRWLRRHQTLATTAVAMVTLAVVLLSIAGYWLSRKNGELDRKNGELAESNTRESQARNEAETHLRRNLIALKDLLRTVVLSRGADAVRRDPASLAVVDELTSQMDQLVAEAPNNDEAARFSAFVHYVRAAVAPQSGLPPTVRKDLDTALDRYENWHREAPEDLDAIEGVATTRAERARRLMQNNDFDGARAELVLAHELLAEPIRRGKRVDPMYTLSWANVCLAIAQVSSKTGKPAPADVLPLVDEALAQLEKLGADSKERLTVAILRGRLRAHQGTILAGQQHWPEAIAALEAGLTAINADPAWRSNAVLETRIVLMLKLGALENQRNRTAIGFKMIESAYKLYAELTQQGPDALEDRELADLAPLAFVEEAVKHLRGLDPNKPVNRDEVRRVSDLAREALDRWRKGPHQSGDGDDPQGFARARNAEIDLEKMRSALRDMDR